VTALLDRTWELALREPYYRVRVGLPVETIEPHSIEVLAGRAEVSGAIAADAASLDRSQLDGDDLDALGVIASLAEQDAIGVRHADLQPVATPYQLYGLSSGADVVFGSLQLAEPADVDRFVSLVHDLAGQVAAIAARSHAQAAKGVRVPRPALAGVRSGLEGHKARLMTALVPAADRTAELSAADQARLRDGLDRELAGAVATAFDDLLGIFDSAYEDAAPEGVGFAQFAGGEEAYRDWVRVTVTTDTSPEDWHRIGQEQCRALTERMAEVRARIGFAGTEAEFHERLRSEPRVHAADEHEVEARYLGYMARLEQRLGEWFADIPRAPYGVKRLDPAVEAGVTYGYYEPPTPGSPTGLYRYNASQLDQRSLLSAEALILHELAPGHHFHIARQAEDTALHPLRRESFSPAVFTEGWAEYASGLGWEMDLYDDPWDAYGRLVHERFTAQRLVVDTGMNLLGWTLEQGRTFMREMTTESDVQIGTEVLRYSTDLPSQALAYRAGFLGITDVRERAEKALGTAFDVPDFHRQVLGAGTLPLPVLQARIERWAGAASEPRGR
jgi:uncharacterized protein (DUF885 family)